MKKLLTLALIVSGVISASAQTFQSASFLNAQAVAITNGVSVTNLFRFGVTTNVTDTWYTNLAGTFNRSTNLAQQQVNLLKTIDLWTDKEGRQLGTNSLGLFVRMVGGSAATTNVAFTFTYTPSSSGYPLTSAADEWTVNVLPTGATPMATNIQIPIPNWPAKSITLKRIGVTNVAAASQVWVLETSLIGFPP